MAWLTLDKYWYVGPHDTRVILQCERVRGVALGASTARYALGTHYTWEPTDDDPDRRVVYADTVYEAKLYLLLWRLQLSYVRVRPYKAE